MTGIESLVTVAAAGFGAGVGAFVTHRLQRARPRAYVNSCELSSTLMSLVDHIDMPETIVAKRDAFRWPLVDEEKYSMPAGATAVPLGAAAEMSHYLREFTAAAETTATLLRRTLPQLEDAGRDRRAAIPLLTAICRDTLFRDLFGGMVRRGELSLLGQATTIDTSGDTFLPWVEDIATGPMVGVMGAYSIHIGLARLAFHFKWQDEQRAFKAATFVLAGGQLSLLKDLLREVLEQLERDRVTAADLKTWLTENMELNSKVTIDVTVANIGTAPLMVSRRAELLLTLHGKDFSPLPVYNEASSESSESGQATSRVVKSLLRVGKQLDRPVSVAQWVPREDIFVAVHGEKRITVRAAQTFTDLADGKTQLHLYQSREVNAVLRMYEIKPDGREPPFESNRFRFSSSLIHQ